jgi:hypothetical protein
VLALAPRARLRDRIHSLVMVLSERLPGGEIGSLRESRHRGGVVSENVLYGVLVAVSVSTEPSSQNKAVVTTEAWRLSSWKNDVMLHTS